MAWSREVHNQLIGAMHEGDTSEFRRLLRSHPDNIRYKDGRDYFLASAAADGLIEFLSILVEEFGLDIDSSRRVDCHEPPIYSAVMFRQKEALRWLVEHGATLNQVVDGKVDCPALNMAVAVGDLDLVKFLVERGADFNAPGPSGRNAYMSAYTQEIKDYLRSVGGVDLRGKVPPDYEGGHKRILRTMQNYAEEDGHWGDVLKWTMELPGDPAITLHACSTGPGRNNKLLFTIGMSDVTLEEEGREHGYGVELMLCIPPKWKLTKKANDDPQWNWPIRLLERLARHIIANGRLNIAKSTNARGKTYAITETFSDPPQPLVPDTQLCAWLLLDCGRRDLPDTRMVQFLSAIPIYAEELAFVRERADHEALVRRFARLDIPRELQLNRPNAVTDWPEGEPEPDWEQCDM